MAGLTKNYKKTITTVQYFTVMGKINHVCNLLDIVSVVRATLLAQIQKVHAQF